jgi:hypothetical protein
MATAKKPEATAKALELHFVFVKATTHAMRYQQDEPESGSRPEVGPLYITQEAWKDLGKPSTLDVIITPGTEE